MVHSPPHTQVAVSPLAATQPIEIVVLDDDDVDLEIFRRCVAGLSQLSVHLRLFSSVAETCEALLTVPCDLLFVDYHLGSSTGVDALKELRALGLSPATILMTGDHGEDVLRDAIVGGFIEYIPKGSIIPEVVAQVIRSSLAKAQLKAEIQEKQRALEATVTSLQTSQEEIGRFYHSVSHELKTPLTGIREFVSLVQDGAVGEVSEAQSDLLGAAIRNCDRMVGCINDMLDAARIETGKLVLNPRSTVLGEVVEDATRSLAGVSESKGVEVLLEVHGSAREETLLLDPGRIFQVVANLLSNGIKFTPKGGQIRVRASVIPGVSATVSVKDSGCGLSAEHQARVFDRLYQSREEDAALLGGMGMGLFICREIVHLHGGRITVDSKEGDGAEFTFVLPLHHRGPSPLPPDE